MAVNLTFLVTWAFVTLFEGLTFNNCKIVCITRLLAWNIKIQVFFSFLLSLGDYN